MSKSRQAMIDYLRVKAEEGDWHAVADAACDLRVLEAKGETPTAHMTCANGHADVAFAFDPKRKPGQEPCPLCREVVEGRIWRNDAMRYKELYAKQSDYTATWMTWAQSLAERLGVLPGYDLRSGVDAAVKALQDGAEKMSAERADYKAPRDLLANKLQVYRHSYNERLEECVRRESEVKRLKAEIAQPARGGGAMSLADGFIPRPEQPGPKKGGWIVRLVVNLLGAVKWKGPK